MRYQKQNVVRCVWLFGRQQTAFLYRDPDLTKLYVPICKLTYTFPRHIVIRSFTDEQSFIPTHSMCTYCKNSKKGASIPSFIHHPQARLYWKQPVMWSFRTQDTKLYFLYVHLKMYATLVYVKINIDRPSQNTLNVDINLFYTVFAHGGLFWEFILRSIHTC